MTVTDPPTAPARPAVVRPDRRRDPRHRPRRRDRRIDDRRHPPARCSRTRLSSSRPSTSTPTQHMRVRPPLRRAHRGPSGHPRHRGPPRGLRDRLHEVPRAVRHVRRPHRTPGARRALAHRRHVRRAPAARIDPQRHRDPAGGRRHAVVQPGRGLRGPERRRCSGFLDGLTAVHGGKEQFTRILASRATDGEWDGAVYDQLQPVVHPVVRTHPETGERALFVNPGFTSHIVELDAAGERCAARVPVPAQHEARVHGALPLDGRRPRVLGQPRDPARRRRRLRRPAPSHPAGHPPRRQAGLTTWRASDRWDSTGRYGPVPSHRLRQDPLSSRSGMRKQRWSRRPSPKVV